MEIQIHEAQKSPNRTNTPKITPRHIIINLSKGKGKVTFESRKRKMTFHIQRNPPMSLSTNFSAETLVPGKRGGGDIFKW